MDFVRPLEAVFPGAAASVVSVLARTPQPLTLRQIAERAGISHPQVARHVDRLEDLGVVRRTIVGRGHQVTLTDSAASELLRRIVHLDETVLDRMRTTASQLGQNAVSVTVYGSFARGQAVTGSDIDVAVIAEDPTDQQWLDDLAAWVEAIAEFAGNPVAEIVIGTDEVASRAAEPLWTAIRSEGVTIAGRSAESVFAGGPPPAS